MMKEFFDKFNVELLVKAGPIVLAILALFIVYKISLGGADRIVSAVEAHNSRMEIAEVEDANVKKEIIKVLNDLSKATDGNTAAIRDLQLFIRTNK